MCGICCRISLNLSKSFSSTNLHEKQNLVFLLSCRGPDSQNYIPFQNETFSLEMTGTTLWMQGNESCVQPLQSSHGAILFNGDIFDNNRNKSICDTEDILRKLSHETDQQNPNGNNVINVLKSLVGPFSLIYWDKKYQKVYFCRDKYGRKSLLLYKNKDEIILSSVLDKTFENAIELSTKFIYSFDLNKMHIEEYPWLDESITNEPVHIDKWSPSNCISLQNQQIIPSVLHSQALNVLEKIQHLSEIHKCPIEFLKNVLCIETISDNVNKLIELLSESVKLRVNTQPGRCKICVNSKVKCNNHATVGILFSGGLDCTILAALAHKHLPPNESIDLLNVAFEHKNCENFNVPDRITSLQSLEELKRLFPKRNWNLLQINVSTLELREKQNEIISDLIFPLQSVLDDSLGSALWFAARGEVDSYSSSCRVLLMGMGADELFGGYTRHRNAFSRGGWAVLEKELLMDWQRLPHRNLARDDRVVSHHGRQPRMPYLDENFLKYILKLNPWEKCFPSKTCGVGTGDKMLLRLAAFKLGLERTSTFPKRAIQFGSKIANKKENANDISPRLTDVLEIK